MRMKVHRSGSLTLPAYRFRSGSRSWCCIRYHKAVTAVQPRRECTCNGSARLRDGAGCPLVTEGAVLIPAPLLAYIMAAAHAAYRDISVVRLNSRWCKAYEYLLRISAALVVSDSAKRYRYHRCGRECITGRWSTLTLAVVKWYR